MSQNYKEESKNVKTAVKHRHLVPETGDQIKITVAR